MTSRRWGPSTSFINLSARRTYVLASTIVHLRTWRQVSFTCRRGRSCAARSKIGYLQEVLLSGELYERRFQNRYYTRSISRAQALRTRSYAAGPGPTRRRLERADRHLPALYEDSGGGPDWTTWWA